MTARRGPAAAVTALSDPAAQLRVDAACRTLALPTVRAEAGRIAEAAARERLSHGAFLAEVLTAECDDRDSRRRIRLVHEAKFPRSKRLADFDHTALPDLPAATLAQLAEGAWITAGEPVVLLGDSGTGGGGSLAQVSLHPRQFRVTTCARGSLPEPICGRTPPRRQNRHQLHYPTPHLFTRTSRNGAAIRPHLTPPPTGPDSDPKNRGVGPNQTSTVGPDGVVILSQEGSCRSGCPGGAGRPGTRPPAARPACGLPGFGPGRRGAGSQSPEFAM